MLRLFSFKRAWMSLLFHLPSDPQLESWGWFFYLRLESWGWFSKSAPVFRLVVNEVTVPPGFSR
jgi:hypothetical protein